MSIVIDKYALFLSIMFDKNEHCVSNLTDDYQKAIVNA